MAFQTTDGGSLGSPVADHYHDLEHKADLIQEVQGSESKRT